MLKKFILIILTTLLFNFSLSPVFARKVILENGTKVKLKLANSISSSTNDEGEEINFIVADDVNWGREVLIKAGAPAKGVVTKISGTKFLSRGGLIEIKMDYAVAVDGTKVPLYKIIEKTGESRFSMLPSFITWILTPIFVVIENEDARLPENYITDARVDRDIEIEIDDNRL